MADVVIPQIGESVTEGTIGRWFFKEGDLVQKDQPLLEIDSDKATLEVPASASGRLKILVPQGKVAQVGSKIAEIVPSEAAGTSTEASSSSKTASSTNVTPLPTSKAPTPSTSPSAPAASSAGASASYGAPAGATAAAWSEEDLADLTPSQRKAARHGEFVKPQGNLNVVLDPSADAVRTPMTTLRKRIAERLLQSQQTTATLTTFNEIDMSNAMKIRSELKDQFEKQHQVKLGFMSFFSKAVLYAMEQYPDMNAHIEGTEIVAPRGVHLGIAVSTTRGLVVPVIRNAESLNFSQLEKRILDLAEKARTGKLSIPEMQGGTFTITNGGVFGSLLSTPILNPPQSGILGMHKIEHRPIAIEKSKGEFSIEVRPMMYVALSYDHRLIDGSTSVGFLVKVKEYLEKVVTRDAVL